MAEFLLKHLAWWPAALLICAGGLIGVMEARWPRQQRDPARARRWPVNLALYGAGVALIVWGGSSLNDAAIRWGGALGWGGIAAAPWPDAAKVALGLVVVDLLQYVLHRLSHAVPLLWRLHQVHHADESFDVSTSVRHHPLETVVLSVFTLMGCAALGVPILSLVFYLLLQVVHAAFCHANLTLPEGVDRWLRLFSSRRICTASTIRCTRRRVSAILRWCSRGGTASLAPTRARPRRGMRRCVSVWRMCAVAVTPAGGDRWPCPCVACQTAQDRRQRCRCSRHPLHECTAHLVEDKEQSFSYKPRSAASPVAFDSLNRVCLFMHLSSRHIAAVCAVAALTCGASAHAGVVFTFSKSFGAPTIPLNGSTTLAFEITRPLGAEMRLALRSPTRFRPDWLCLRPMVSWAPAALAAQ